MLDITQQKIPGLQVMILLIAPLHDEAPRSNLLEPINRAIGKIANWSFPAAKFLATSLVVNTCANSTVVPRM